MAPPTDPNVLLQKVNGLVLPPDLGRDGEWRLARRSLPVIAGREHNYVELTFVPSNGGAPELVGEIHGVSHDREKNTYGAVSAGTGTDLVGTRTENGQWGKQPTDKNIELVRDVFDPKQAVMRDAGEGYRNLNDVMRQGLEDGQQKP